MAILLGMLSVLCGLAVALPFGVLAELTWPAVTSLFDPNHYNSVFGVQTGPLMVFGMVMGLLVLVGPTYFGWESSKTPHGHFELRKSESGDLVLRGSYLNGNPTGNWVSPEPAHLYVGFPLPLTGVWTQLGADGTTVAQTEFVEGVVKLQYLDVNGAVVEKRTSPPWFTEAEIRASVEE